MYQLNRICVLCLRDNTLFKTEFHEISRNDIVQYVLPELMISCSEIPVYICPECHKKLNFVYTYKKQCLESYNRWKNYIKQIQGTGSTQDLKYTELQLKLTNCKPPIKQELNTDIELNTKEKNVEDHIDLSLQVDDKEDLELYQHLATYEEPTEELIDSPEPVQQIIASIEPVKQMVDSVEPVEKMVVPPEPVEKMVVPPEPVEEMVACTEPVEESAQSSDSPDEEFYQIADFLNCELRLDEQNYDNNENNFYYSYAGNQVSPYSTFDQHVPSTSFECNLCKRKFSKKSYLTRHLARSKVHDCHQCTICNETFTLPRKLKAHEKLHKIMKFREDKKVQCIICDKVYANADYLKQHVKFIHEGSINIKCHVCNLPFRANSYLKAHMKVHKEILVLE